MKLFARVGGDGGDGSAVSWGADFFDDDGLGPFKLMNLRVLVVVDDHRFLSVGVEDCALVVFHNVRLGIVVDHLRG